MSSPIHLDDDIDPNLIYAPPWARERILLPNPRLDREQTPWLKK
jgi:hypothetical protein